MPWARTREVLNHYRMLTRLDAVLRQLAVSGGCGLAVAFCDWILHPRMSPLTLIMLSGLAYFAVGVCLDSAHRRLTRRSLDSSSMRESSAAVEGDPENNAPQIVSPLEPDGSAFHDRFGKVVCLGAKLAAAAAVGYLLTRGVRLLPLSLGTFELFVVTSGAAYAGCVAMLSRIERLEIDEFPTRFRDRTMAWTFKRLSHGRGYYFIGQVGRKKIGLPRMTRFLHCLVAGPTGQGKSSSLIIPQLLFDADSVGSAVVPDAKSPELFNWVAGRWLKNGKKAFLFDPWHPDTVGMNPLLDADEMDLQTIVEVMMREREEVIGKEDPFFKSRTRYLLYAILKLVQSFRDEYCNLAAVYHVVESVVTLEKFIDTSPDEIKSLFADYSKLYSETRVNALTSIREKLEPFADSAVRRAFSRSEFRLDMLFREKDPCLLVLGAPIDKKEPGTKIASLIVNLIINNAFKERRMMKQAVQRGDRYFVPNDLYLYLDELRNLKVTALADLVSIARETKTQVIGSITDIPFFKYYHEDFSSLMGNFRTRICMRGLDYDSSKYVSDSLGKVNVATYKYFRGLMASQEQRNLLDPDRVMNLPDDRIIVFNPRTAPFVCRKVSIYDSPWLKRMHVAPPKAPREHYGRWGLASSPLVDPSLPKYGDEYDMKAIRSEKEVRIDRRITPETFIKEAFRETGGGQLVRQQGAFALFGKTSAGSKEEVGEGGRAQGDEDSEIGIQDA